ncbi:putative pentatricopeptide repeat-containing protein At1g09680 [Jatropha curcas]|nr:putative pentatricopeptide repeat-containing protein At1g09680 [Jatropha curcas]
MPSPYAIAQHHLLQPLFLGNTFNLNYRERPATNLIFLPKLSLFTAGIADKNAMAYPKRLSHLIDKKGITLVVKHNNGLLPIQQKNPETIEKTRRLQVENFVAAIKALPSKDKTTILDIFTKNGKICSTAVFNDLLMALVIASEHELAFKFYSSISSYGLAPDCWTYCILIRSYCKIENVDEARRVLDHMVENGLHPNLATFTTLINSFCKKGRVEEAFELMEDIKKSSIDADVYTYTALMDGFCKVGRTDEAMELLNEAMEIGLKPNIVTFNTLFDGFSREGRPLEGIGVLKKMKQINCRPDYISYSTLLHGLLMWRKIRTALRIYKEMVRNGFEVDERLMNNLLRGLCRKFLKENDLLEDAYQVFDKMTKRAFVMDHSTYNLVIQAFSMGKKVDDALVSLQKMIKFGYIPSLTTINSVIRAFCTKGRVEKAILVLVLMYETHKIPNTTSYDLMIQELNRQRRFLGASNVYGSALVRGVVPNQMPLHEKLLINN